jgi:hypothetical protein
MYGNNTKTQEIEVKPLLQNHPKTNVQINANKIFINTNVKETPLNKATIVEITAIEKYILAGVQSSLKFFIYIKYYIFYFNDKKNGFLNLFFKCILLNIKLLDVFLFIFFFVFIPRAVSLDNFIDDVFSFITIYIKLPKLFRS